MEKLLWTCPLKNIAVLVRGKNEFTAHQRIKDIYETPVSIQKYFTNMLFG